MTFATAKELPASRRFMLIRITPARYVSDDLTDDGSGVYSMTFAFDSVARVERNGTELTKVATVSSNDDYSFDETTKELTVKLASAPSSTNVIIVFYRLFYTGDGHVVAPEDPEAAESASNPLRTWQPRLERYPEIRQSVGNALAGILSYDTTKIELVNADNDFEQYLTINDSFYQKEVDIWLCINNVANIKPLYRGLVSSVRKTDTTVTLGLLDNFSRLNQSCYMGDSAADCYGNDTNSSQLNKPIPFMVGDETRYIVQQEQNIHGSDVSTTMLDPNSLLEGVCTGYDSDNTTSDNRTWSLCRTDSDGFGSELYGTTIQMTHLNGVSSGSSSDQLITVHYPETDPVQAPGQTYEGQPPQAYFLRVGDTIFIDTATGSVYGIISKVSLGELTVFIEDNNSAVTFSDTITFKSQTAIVITNGGQSWYPCETRDYTLSTETLDSGNKLLKVTFVNNFEQYHPGLDVLTPDTLQVRFRTLHGGYVIDPGPSEAWRHQNVLESICTQAGLTIADDSFSSGTYENNGRLLFSVPYFDQTDIGSYRQYAEDILKSMLGYMKLNDSFKAEYFLFAAPSASNVVDSAVRIDGSTSTEIVYEDIATTVRAENPHAPFSNVWFSYGLRSTKAKHLHGIDRQKTIRVLLKSPYHDAPNYIDFMSTRRVTYRFQTATLHLDALIGDQLTFESPQILGGSGTDNLQIITLDKGADKTTVEATDLEGL